SRMIVPVLVTVKVSVSDWPTDAVAEPSDAAALIVAMRGGLAPSLHTPALQNWDDGQFWSVSHVAPSRGGTHPIQRASGTDSRSAARRLDRGRGRSRVIRGFQSLRGLHEVIRNPARSEANGHQLRGQKLSTTGAPPAAGGTEAEALDG